MFRNSKEAAHAGRYIAILKGNGRNIHATRTTADDCDVKMKVQELSVTNPRKKLQYDTKRAKETPVKSIRLCYST